MDNSDTPLGHNRNNANIELIQALVQQKLSDIPHTTSCITTSGPERANFPYAHWFQGDYRLSSPVVAEREAGHLTVRPLKVPPRVDCADHAYPQHCFKGATTVEYPCYPECTTRKNRREHVDLLRNSKLYLYR